MLRLEPDRNAAVVGTRDEISRTTYELSDVRFVAGEPPSSTFETSVVLRYRGIGIAGRVDVHGTDATIELRSPALVAPGQAAVFYDADEVVGGGVVNPDSR